MAIDRSTGPAGSLAWTLSIDFGTSSTVVVASTDDGQTEVIEVEGERRIPSVVLLDDNNSSWVIGRAAVDLARSQPARIVRAPKRRLGEQTPLIVAGHAFRPVAVVAEILRFAADAATRSIGSEPGAVRMTYPATWNRQMQARLAEAAAGAGLPEPTFIPEPVAAVFSLPRQAAAGTEVAVYDLGGGTFDTTIVRSTALGYEVIGRPTGDPTFGGELFDEILLNYVGEQLDEEIWDSLQVSDEPEWLQTRMRLLNDCRRVKEALTTSLYADVTVGHPTGLIEQRVTRPQLERLVAPYIDESIDLVDRAIADAGISPTDLEAIHLIGGASRMPIIKDRVGAAFAGVAIHQLGDPRTAVALGASRATLQKTDAAGNRSTLRTNETVVPQPPPSAPVRPGSSPSPAPNQPSRAEQPSATPAQPATPINAPAPSPPPAMPPATHATAPRHQPAAPTAGPPPTAPVPRPATQPGQPAPPPDASTSPSSGSRMPLVAASIAMAVLVLGALAVVFRPGNDATAPTTTIVIERQTVTSTVATTTPTTAAPTTLEPTTTAPTTAESTTTTPPDIDPAQTVTPNGGPTASDVERTLVVLGDLPAEDNWVRVGDFEYNPFTFCDTPAPTPPVYLDGSTFDKGTGGDTDRIVSRTFVYATEEDAAVAMERDRQLFATCAGGQIEINGNTFNGEFITPDGDPVEGIGDEILISGVIFSFEGENVSYMLMTSIRHGRTISETGYQAPEPVDGTRNSLLLELTFSQFLTVIGLDR